MARPRRSPDTAPASIAALAEYPPAAPWRRLVATLIDGAPIIAILMATLVLVWLNRDLPGTVFTGSGVNPDARYATALSALAVIALPLALLAWMLVGAIAAWRNRPSPGKRLLALRVDSEPGVAHARGKRVAREVLWKGVLPILSLLVAPWAPLAYLAAMMLPVIWRPDRRAFHDLITGVQLHHAPRAPQAPPAAPSSDDS